MKKLLIVTMILSVIGLSANGFAQMGAGHQGKGMRGAYKNTPWFTGLTAEQQTEAKTIIDSNIKEITSLRLKMNEKKAKLDTILFKDGTSQKNIDKVVSEINAIRSKLYQKDINMSIALKKAGVPHPFYKSPMGSGGRGKKAGMSKMGKMKDCPMMHQGK
ncbi:MAG: hypothetical protein JRJ49_07450 [Deltaproteobacteria bacterium]|nr:hypothetical protein [Deltaproteobacteria bacterium]